MKITIDDSKKILANTFYITAYFGNEYVEIEDEYYQHNEILTALLNHDFSSFYTLFEGLKTNHSHENTELYNKTLTAINKNLSSNPIFKKLGINNFLKNSKPDFRFYKDFYESVKLIQDTYKYFCDALYTHKKSLAGELDKRRFINLGVFENSSKFTNHSNGFTSNTCFEVKHSVRTNSQLLFERVTFTNFIDFIYADFYKGIMKDFSPKKCKLCGKYFLQDNGHIFEYCNNPSESNPAKTCREIGSKKSFAQKSKNDEIWQIYLRAYKKYHSRKQKHLMSPEQFEEWRYKAEDIRDHALRERDKLTKDNKPFDIAKYKADINFIK